MSADWTAFDMAEALRAAVVARIAALDPALEPTPRVITYLPNPDEQLPDAIIIGYLSSDSEDNQRAHVGGNRFNEEVGLTSRIQVTRPGAGQDVADTARARAQALLAEIDDEVRDNLPPVGDQSWGGIVVDRDAALIATNRDGTPAQLAVIDFTIRYVARTSS